MSPGPLFEVHLVNQSRTDILNGWKEIAAYLGRDPRTVERWEKQRSLPVRRLPGSGRASVYALVPELDAWLASSPMREVELPPLQPSALGGAGLVLPPDWTERSLPAQVPDFASVPVESPKRQHRVPVWLGWMLSAGLLLLLAWAGSVLAGRSKVRSAEASASGSTEGPRLRRMVPPSPVLGVEQLYLRGCYQAELRTAESLRRAQGTFQAAIGKDPGYAPAFAGLANTFLLLREYSTTPDEEAYAKAKQAAGTALRLDPNLPQAHAAMGFVQFFGDWDALGAEREFTIALRLDPELALSHHWYGSMLTHEGRFAEGLRELEIAQRLDPTSAAILTSKAFALGLSGRRDEAADLLEEAISSEKMGPYRNPATMHNVLGILSLLSPRDLPRYLSETMVAAELREDTETVAAMRLADETYRARGEPAMWRALLAGEQTRHARDGPTYAMARYEAELGAREQALDHLAALFVRHDPALIGIAADPLLANLREDPRFVQIRSRMGLPHA